LLPALVIAAAREVEPDPSNVDLFRGNKLVDMLQYSGESYRSRMQEVEVNAHASGMSFARIRP